MTIAAIALCWGGAAHAMPERSRWQYQERPNALIQFAHDHIELGLQIYTSQLNETRRQEFDASGTFTGGFLGSIDQLHVEQRDMLTPLVRLKWNEYVGIQMGVFSLGARTTTFWDGHTDGSFRLSGPTIEIYARAKQLYRFSPYAAAGIAPLRARFSHDELWHNGFSPAQPAAYRAWVASGRPEWPNGGYQRTIAVDDTTAWLISGGFLYHLNETWKLDFAIRHMEVDVDANFYLSWYGVNRRDQGSYKIPMSNWTALLGMLYDF